MRGLGKAAPGENRRHRYLHHSDWGNEAPSCKEYGGSRVSVRERVSPNPLERKWSISSRMPQKAALITTSMSLWIREPLTPCFVAEWRLQASVSWTVNILHTETETPSLQWLYWRGFHHPHFPCVQSGRNAGAAFRACYASWLGRVQVQCCGLSVQSSSFAGILRWRRQSRNVGTRSALYL